MVLRKRIPSAKMPSQSGLFHSNRMLSSSGVSSKTGTKGGLAGVRVSGAEADAILMELAEKDEDAQKTWSRMFFENVLSKVCRV